LNDGNDVIRAFSAVALGQINSPRALEPLIAALGDPNEEVRTWSAWALGELADPRAIKPLVLLMDDSSPNVRKEAVHALKMFKNPETVELIAGLLQDKNLRDRCIPQQKPSEQAGSGEEPPREPQEILPATEGSAVSVNDGSVCSPQEEYPGLTISPDRSQPEPAVEQFRGSGQPHDQPRPDAVGPAPADIYSLDSESAVSQERGRHPETEKETQTFPPGREPEGSVPSSATAGSMEAATGEGAAARDTLPSKDLPVIQPEHLPIACEEVKALQNLLGQIEQPCSTEFPQAAETGSRTPPDHISLDREHDALLEGIMEELEDDLALNPEMEDKNSKTGQEAQVTCPAPDSGEGESEAPPDGPVPGADRAPAGIMPALQKEVFPAGPSGEHPVVGMESPPDQSPREPESSGCVEMQHFFDRDPHVQILTIKALEEAKSANTVKILTQSLQNENAEIRITAVRALGEFGGSDGIGAIVAALHDPASEVQETAKQTLARLRNQVAIAAFLGAEQKPPDNAAVSSVTPLIKALSDASEEFRIWAAWALGELRVAEAVPYLIQAIREPDPPGSQCAAMHSSRIMQAESAHALVKIGEQAIKPIIQKLNDNSEDFKRFAAAVLILQHESAIKPLIDALQTGESVIREEAVSILGRIGEAAVEALIGTMQAADPATRVLAIRSLIQIRDPRAVSPLIISLRDKNEEVRTIAAHALGDLRDAKAIMPLIRALRDPSKQVRDQAVDALATIGDVLEVPA
jgi:HEAT repeat protein